MKAALAQTWRVTRLILRQILIWLSPTGGFGMDPIMQFFEVEHLPMDLRTVAQPFCDLAKQIEATLPDNQERDIALRRLLESKDAAVRAKLFKGEFRG